MIKSLLKGFNQVHCSLRCLALFDPIIGTLRVPHFAFGFPLLVVAIFRLASSAVKVRTMQRRANVVLWISCLQGCGNLSMGPYFAQASDPSHTILSPPCVLTFPLPFRSSTHELVSNTQQHPSQGTRAKQHWVLSHPLGTLSIQPQHRRVLC